MKAKNVIGQRIIIEGSYSEIARLTVILDDYIARNQDDEMAKEMVDILRNPVVETGKQGGRHSGGM